MNGGPQIVGAFEHPTRFAPDKTVAQLHAEAARGALADAGLTKDDVDGYFCSGDAPGGALSMANYLNLRLRHCDTLDVGGSSAVAQVAQACAAIQMGKCNVALITQAGRPKSLGVTTGTKKIVKDSLAPDVIWELPYAVPNVANYALVAARHFYEFGTTSEQLAWVRVAASHHAQHNPNAVLRKLVTVDDVLQSPLISDPLHRLDCCLITDGGGAIVVARNEIAVSLRRPAIRLRGAGLALKHQEAGAIDLTYSAAAQSGREAFSQAGIDAADIRYASIYDSFTITVIIQLEDLGFCPKGKGGAFVADGNLIANVGRLAVNTDGGGLCNNHPANRGGITKVIEAVRQLQQEAVPAVQVKNCELACVQATGGHMATRHASATLILERT
ncbi:thiolase domain-containing protein [Rhizobium ruizarguesonis]|uniref:thiolase domain-containing protein n=1 Tax=Rhizobium TaxID=379 RepID=UPI0013BFE14E|nr:thiolase domain-containing protein [Rhizobium ruizarguesonis]NEI96607.1 thiolase domain-containing protein [Rhizobium ruizarguesonis]NEJ33770.1 thiolase domain-containing protein [Rhizobium ruizarguesonis]